MIYTIDKANMIAEQLRRFTSGYAHHIAGQFANIDFWLNEVLEAVKTLDEHKIRFVKMRDDQKDWVEKHGTTVYEYCGICKGKCEFSTGIPSVPRNKYKREIKEARYNLMDSAYYFLVRCHKIGLLNDKTIAEKCDLLGVSIDPSDL